VSECLDTVSCVGGPSRTPPFSPFLSPPLRLAYTLGCLPHQHTGIHTHTYAAYLSMLALKFAFRMTTHMRNIRGMQTEKTQKKRRPAQQLVIRFIIFYHFYPYNKISPTPGSHKKLLVFRAPKRRQQYFLKACNPLDNVNFLLHIFRHFYINYLVSHLII